METYTFTFYSADGALFRMTTRPCADLKEAIRHAAGECGLCRSMQIRAQGKVVWSGSPAEAELTLTHSVAEEGTGLHP
ncbi:MAG TPA: hypothetical protein VHU18_05930 [Rhizomicrobium sp.]|jgi:hypothetical protein|nr:hypothetical protein [Rhizomicrobium sp.]